MLLSSLEFSTRTGLMGDYVRANVRLPDGKWCDVIRHPGGGAYDIYRDTIEDSQSTNHTVEQWKGLDPIAAQCVIFHLFQVTPGGNKSERTDQDQTAS